MNFCKFAILVATAALAPTVAWDAASAQSSLENSRIPMSEYSRSPNMRNPTISPDGTKLAYRASKAGKEVLVVLDLANPQAQPKIVLQSREARESGERALAGYRWVGNNYLVMTIQVREDLGNGPGDFGRLVSYDLSSGKLTQLAWEGSAGNASSILYIDHKNAALLLERTSTKENQERWGIPEVVRVDVATGKYTMVQRTNPEIEGWSADANGVVRYGSAYDGDKGMYKILYRSNEKEQLKTVLKDKVEYATNPPDPIAFIEGTDTAYVTSRKDGFTKVYKFDIINQKFSDPVFETPGFDVENVILSDDRKTIDGYVTFDGDFHNVYTNPRLKEIQALLDETFGKDESAIVDYDDYKEKILVSAGGRKKRAGYYLFDTVAGKIQLLNWESANLKDSPLNPVTAEWFTASDGMKIQAIVTYPRHRNAKNLPVIIAPHGGPFGVFDAVSQSEPWNQPLAEAGYVVIQPNYRGSGGYGKEFEKEGRKPNGYGIRMQDDLTDVLNHYAQLGIIDPKRACILGWSYGGYAAARGAQRDPDLWRCAIAGAGVYDMPMMNKWDKDRGGKFSAGFQATSSDPVAISSARNTDGKWAPILIVAGLRDARIPIEQSRTLVARLKASGKKEDVDFRYIEQKQGTHNLPYDDLYVQWFEETEKWLDRFNPAYIDSDPDKPVPIWAPPVKATAAAK